MELLFEILFEVYGELMVLIVPEKRADKKYLIITKIFAVLVFLGVLALTIWGIILITDHNNLVGIAPISIAAVISIGQIAMGIFLYNKNARSDRSEK